MSKWDKLIAKLQGSPNEMRFQDLAKILEKYGYTMKETGGGSSHCTFRKVGYAPITIPRHGSITKTYIEMVREVIESQEVLQ